MNIKLTKKSLNYLLVFYFIFSFAFALYYALEQSKKKTDASFKKIMFSKDLIRAGADKFLPADSAAYNSMAISLLESKGFQYPNGKYTASVSVGTPIYLAIIYKIFGYRLFWVIFVNTCLATLSLLYIYKIAALVVTEQVAWIAFFLHFINIRFTYHLASIGNYSLFIFLLLLSFYFAIMLTKTVPSIMKYALFGFIAGVIILVRPLVAPVMGIIFIYVFLKERKIKFIMISIVIASLLVSSWLIRNYQKLGMPIFNTRNYIGFLEGNNDAYDNISLSESYYLPSIKLDKKQEQALSEMAEQYDERGYITILMQINNTWVKENKERFVKNIIWRIKGILSPYTRDMSLRNKIIAAISWSFMFIPGLIGLATLPDKNIRVILTLSCLCFLFIPAIVVVDKYLHYRLPVNILLTITAASAYNRFFAKFINCKHANNNLNTT